MSSHARQARRGAEPSASKLGANASRAARLLSGLLWADAFVLAAILFFAPLQANRVLALTSVVSTAAAVAAMAWFQRLLAVKPSASQRSVDREVSASLDAHRGANSRVAVRHAEAGMELSWRSHYASMWSQEAWTLLLVGGALAAALFIAGEALPRFLILPLIVVIAGLASRMAAAADDETLLLLGERDWDLSSTSGGRSLHFWGTGRLKAELRDGVLLVSNDDGLVLRIAHELSRIEREAIRRVIALHALRSGTSRTAEQRNEPSSGEQHDDDG